MGYIYSGINQVSGFCSSVCVGKIDDNGYVYNGINQANGFCSGTCVGRVDENGYVYNGINQANGFCSSTCVGKVDENGYVYNGINQANGFCSSTCVGKVDENGYVYNGINQANGFCSSACIGKVDVDAQYKAAGAALLLLLEEVDFEFINMDDILEDSEEMKKSAQERRDFINNISSGGYGNGGGPLGGFGIRGSGKLGNLIGDTVGLIIFIAMVWGVLLFLNHIWGGGGKSTTPVDPTTDSTRVWYTDNIVEITPISNEKTVEITPICDDKTVEIVPLDNESKEVVSRYDPEKENEATSYEIQKEVEIVQPEPVQAVEDVEIENDDSYEVPETHNSVEIIDPVGVREVNVEILTETKNTVEITPITEKHVEIQSPIMPRQNIVVIE